MFPEGRQARKHFSHVSESWRNQETMFLQQTQTWETHMFLNFLGRFPIGTGPHIEIWGQI
jgi:hypothetical protein